MENNKEHKFSIKRVLFGLTPVLIVIIIAVFFVSSNDKESEVVKKVEEPSRTEVCVEAQMLIEKTLKSPATADFPTCNEFSITKTTDGGYVVESYVDSQNSFGALIRSEWAVGFSYVNEGTQVRTEFLTVDGEIVYVRE